MNILMISNNYTPYAGGVVSSINAQIEALQKLGHCVTLITLDFLGTVHHDPSWVKRLYCPIKFTYKKNHMALPWRAKKQIKALMQELKPDVVHVHHPFLLGPIGAKVAQQMHIPVIFTYHTVYEAYVHYVPLPESLLKPLVKKMVLAFCKQVDGIVTPSSYIQNYLIGEGVKTPMAVIPSGLLPFFLLDNVKPRPIEQSDLHLLVVSRMVKEKNIEAVLRVAQRLAHKDIKFKFTLIGYGNDYETLQNYAYDQLKLSKDVVHFIHKPPKAEIAQAYQGADIFLFSSKTDTQGLVLAEAMAAGAPVVAFDGPGQQDIINEAQNGYIVPNEEKMGDAIEALSKDHALLHRLSQNAYKTGQCYKPAVLARKLIKFYQVFVSC